MRLEIVFVFMAVVSLVFLGVVIGFSQDEEEGMANQTEAVTSVEAQPSEESPESPDVASDVQWLWGEAVSVDSSKQELVVKYTDYDTDMEKEVAVVLTDNTTLGNIKDLSEIQPHDMVSIDYTIDNDGRYIAKNVGVEKPETAPPQE